MKRARFPIAVLLTAASLTACNLLDSYGREHHFKEEESTALILDADQRVITQRTVEPNAQFEGKIAPGIIICAEPSPDVANALSSAISTSLGAGLPGATGTKNFSADLSMSKAESIVQLGSRIATIQLLRDELADLCRSYANGAVTTTTYTLRLSRLDKKMVTLLLSEAAGRPAGTQSVILGNATAGTRSAATPEEISKARQAVVDASTQLVAKEKELKEAAEDQKASRQAEQELAFRNLQDKQTELMAMERRLLGTSAGSDVQTVLLNSNHGGATPNETLASLQENFLLQDDLTTFLDACISSLDQLQRPLNKDESATLGDARLKLQELEAPRMAAMNDYFLAKAEVERVQGDAKQVAELALAELERKLSAYDVASTIARQQFNEILGRLQPVSRFGEYCQTTALGQLLHANTDRIEARIDMMQERRRLADAQSRSSTLRTCELVLSSAGADPATRTACTAALARHAKELPDSRQTPARVVLDSESQYAGASARAR